MDNCYVPNNPHFGLQLEAGGGGGGGGDGGGGGSPPGPGPAYWSPEDMGSFSLPALDLDPLPSLFPFSPCTSSCKSEFAPLKEKQPHDMADVLLSLKHAVVHPGQAAAAAAAAGQLSPSFAGAYASQGQGQCQGQAYQGPSASLSYTVHPHQMMSPSGGYGASQYCPSGMGAGQDQGGGMFGGGGGAPPQSQHHNMFPSMSVNVSMNMTMHGYPANMADNIQHQVTCPQVQWGPPPPNPSPVYPPPQSLLSPQAYTGGATYSFTADFRPPPVAPAAPPPPPPPEPALLAGGGATFKPSLGKGASFGGVGVGGGMRPRRPPSDLTVVTSGFGHKTPPEATQLDDPPRPNLCRICGKTYARPSTLKTHLRTHSGEKPYRCADCNKSFSQAANLTAHVRTHSGEKPFRCPICDRRFSQSSSVTTHMRTHSGERPYRCRLCKKAFSDSSTLTKHLRIHSGEKPYQCKLCLLRFSQSGNLNRHMRVHGGGGGAGLGGAGLGGAGLGGAAGGGPA